jgi:hypothetical protein
MESQFYVHFLRNQAEDIQHLFFNCHLARSVWRIFYIALKIDRPTSISHILEMWQIDKGTSYKRRILVVVADMFLDYLALPQIIFRSSYWYKF